MKLYYRQKNIEVSKLEMKQLSKNLNFVIDEQSKLKEELKNMEKDQEVLKDKAMETEAKVKSLEDYVEDLKECRG